MRWMTRLALCALVVAGAGCMRFQPTGVPAPDGSGWRAVRRANVTTTENVFYVLRDVQVTADSVTGWLDAGPQGRRVAVHRSQVRRFEQPRVDRIRTGLLGVVAIYVVAVIVGLRGLD